MPELPEVETIRCGLLSRLVGARVVDAQLLRRDVLIAPGDPAGGFSRQRTRVRPKRVAPADLLVGAVVSDVARHGKQIAIIASDDRALGVQLGMTGHLEIGEAGARHGTHAHACWTLSSGSELVFEDARRFGSLRVFRSLDALREHWAALGPDALGTSADQLHGALAGSDRPIKAALLDQSVLAGVGNIYADEALFIARIDPRTRAHRLTSSDSAHLADAIRSVLAQAIDAGGSTVRSYANADGDPGSYQTHHAVYGRAGLPCPACSRPLSAAIVAQRTTVWCAACQPARPRHN